MQAIISTKQFKAEFSRLLEAYDHYYWAVAWASCPKGIFAKLIQHQDRIVQICVGLHFYQTDPGFIQNFIDSDKVKFVPESVGVFHPKVFLFYNHENDWELMIGSANFTDAAFHRNTEVSMLFGAKDQNASQVWSDINGFLKEVANIAKPMSADAFLEYQEKYRTKKSTRDTLSDLRKDEVNDIGSRVKDESEAEFLGRQGVLRVRISTVTNQFNEKYKLYYDHIKRGYSVNEYFGLYWDKEVRLVGRLSKIVHAELKDNGDLVVIEQKTGEGEPLTEAEKQRIKAAINESEDSIATDTRFFLVDEFFEMYFRKKTVFPLRYHKLFDLKRYFSEEEFPKNAKDLAAKLNNKLWEDTLE